METAAAEYTLAPHSDYALIPATPTVVQEPPSLFDVNVFVMRAHHTVTTLSTLLTTLSIPLSGSLAVAVDVIDEWLLCVDEARQEPGATVPLERFPAVVVKTLVLERVSAYLQPLAAHGPLSRRAQSSYIAVAGNFLQTLYTAVNVLPATFFASTVVAAESASTTSSHLDEFLLLDRVLSVLRVVETVLGHPEGGSLLALHTTTEFLNDWADLVVQQRRRVVGAVTTLEVREAVLEEVIMLEEAIVDACVPPVRAALERAITEELELANRALAALADWELVDAGVPEVTQAAIFLTEWLETFVLSADEEVDTGRIAPSAVRIRRNISAAVAIVEVAVAEAQSVLVTNLQSVGVDLARGALEALAVLDSVAGVTAEVGQSALLVTQWLELLAVDPYAGFDFFVSVVDRDEFLRPWVVLTEAVQATTGSLAETGTLARPRRRFVLQEQLRARVVAVLQFLALLSRSHSGLFTPPDSLVEVTRFVSDWLVWVIAEPARATTPHVVQNVTVAVAALEGALPAVVVGELVEARLIARVLSLLAAWAPRTRSAKGPAAVRFRAQLAFVAD